MDHIDTSSAEIWWKCSVTDMEKDQIFPRTRFVNNQTFRKKYISKFLTITSIFVEIIIYRLKICQISNASSKFPQEISFLLKIKAHNLPQSKNFRNSQKFPRVRTFFHVCPPHTRPPTPIQKKVKVKFVLSIECKSSTTDMMRTLTKLRKYFVLPSPTKIF